MASQLALPPDHCTAATGATPEVIESAVADLRRGRAVIVWGGSGSENSGMLAVAADRADAVAVNLMAREARGLVCLALTPAACRRLGLSPMGRGDARRPAADFMVSVEAREGTTTGISTQDRATTIAAAVADGAMPDDLVTPGHVFPLRIARGGVSEFAGNAEAAVDLVRMAGATPAAVLCTVLDDVGALACGEHLVELGQRLGIRIVTAVAVAEHRRTALDLAAPPGYRRPVPNQTAPW